MVLAGKKGHLVVFICWIGWRLLPPPPCREHMRMIEKHEIDRICVRCIILRWHMFRSWGMLEIIDRHSHVKY